MATFLKAMIARGGREVCVAFCEGTLRDYIKLNRERERNYLSKQTNTENMVRRKRHTKCEEMRERKKEDCKRRVDGGVEDWKKQNDTVASSKYL